MLACIPNIGPKQQRRRLLLGVAGLAVSAVVAAALVAADASLVTRAAIALPLYAAALGFFQFREKTWVRLAARGLRDMDGGPESISDAAALNAVRQQARGVQFKSLLAAVLLAALYLLVS